ncbi:MAG: helix-turn-helix domain-containing protein [Planctomycetes bacterium]|nr:helix-turn-helix domain-containing protein [Planctomycetota bacterium]
MPADPSTLNPPFGQAPDRMHATAMAAACIGVAAKSMALDRCRRRWRIAHCKIGRRVAYRESDLLAFLDRCRVEG